jgi:putative glutamine amidotransferase
MSRPLIGLSLRTNWIEELKMNRYGVVETFIHPVEAAGGTPIGIPLKLSHESLRTVYDHLDGLFLPGGVDVHPHEYGEEVAPYCGEIDVARDDVELTMTRWALAEGKPIFAICRGIQLLNVAAGGTLYQDMWCQIEGPRHPTDPLENRSHMAHTVKLDAGSRVARVLSDTNPAVNSLHHQAIRTVGAGLRAVGVAPDGIVEVLEGTGSGFVMAMQFHPEWILDKAPRMIELFREFVRACRCAG